MRGGVYSRKYSIIDYNTICMVDIIPWIPPFCTVKQIDAFNTPLVFLIVRQLYMTRKIIYFETFIMLQSGKYPFSHLALLLHLKLEASLLGLKNNTGLLHLGPTVY